MPDGPFGGPRPFISDTRTVTITIGIDGEEPPRDVAQDIEGLLENELISYSEYGFTDVPTTFQHWRATEEDRERLEKQILTVFQFEIDTGKKEIETWVVEEMGRVARRTLDDHGFNTHGVHTIVS